MIKSELKNLVFRYRVSAVDVSRVKLIVAADRKMAMRRETIEPKIALEAHYVPQLRKIHFPISNDWRPMQLRRGCIIARCVCQCWKDSIHRCGRHCFRSTECCKLGVSFGENKWQSSVKWRPHEGARGRKRVPVTHLGNCIGISGAYDEWRIECGSAFVQWGAIQWTLAQRWRIVGIEQWYAQRKHGSLSDAIIVRSLRMKWMQMVFHRMNKSRSQTHTLYERKYTDCVS